MKSNRHYMSYRREETLDNLFAIFTNGHSLSHKSYLREILGPFILAHVPTKNCCRYSCKYLRQTISIDKKISNDNSQFLSVGGIYTRWFFVAMFSLEYPLFVVVLLDKDCMNCSNNVAKSKAAEGATRW